MKTPVPCLIPVILSQLTFHSCKREQAPQKPNFIFFITDDISFNDIGCYGNENAKTPHLDKMAGEGLVFENAYLTASSCSPSRCSIITGRYPHNTGAPELHTSLPSNQVMFPQLLKEAGYYTLLSGKNHMGEIVHRAFDTVIHGKGPGGEEEWVDLIRNRPIGKPFFFWFASYDAHRPWQTDSTSKIFDPDSVWVPPMLYDGQMTREDLALYYHEVSRTDYYLGQIMEELKREGIDLNTLVIYCSDNGRPFPRCKVRLYDSGIKTPFIVTGPGVKKGRTSSLISTIDIAPTILEMADLPRHERVQGVSFLPILHDPSNQTRSFIFAEHNWHVYQGHERMIRYGDWMLIRNAFPNRRNMSVESSPHFPVGEEIWNAYEKRLTLPAQEDIFRVPRPEEELYNVKEDPFQFNDVIDDPANAEILSFLRENLDTWVKKTGDHVPDPITPDRETLERVQYKGWKHMQMAGAQLGADTICASGPF